LPVVSSIRDHPTGTRACTHKRHLSAFGRTIPLAAMLPTLCNRLRDPSIPEVKSRMPARRRRRVLLPPKTGYCIFGNVCLISSATVLRFFRELVRVLTPLFRAKVEVWPQNFTIPNGKRRAAGKLKRRNNKVSWRNVRLTAGAMGCRCINNQGKFPAQSQIYSITSAAYPQPSYGPMAPTDPELEVG
jgi:hypothetical protein